ncbi:MAG: type VII secretion protein EssC [Peptococcaceae bacterium]|nr:type VII secretion protein EssC [Peptococcaceae bacterium]
MLVALLTQKTLTSVTLPDKVTGQYWLNEPPTDPSAKLIGIEGQDGEWVVKSNKKAVVLDDQNQNIRSAILKPLNIHNVRITKTKEKTILYTEPITEDRQIYTKYRVETDLKLTIGRQDNNDIIIINPYVSSTHVNIAYTQGRWSVADSSTNGTFVNGKRVKKQQTLKPGDVIAIIMGFKIIIGADTIAFNNPDGKVRVATQALKPLVRPPIRPPDPDDDEDHTGEYDDIAFHAFSRSPRFKIDIEKPVYRIDSPPQNTTGEETPLMLVLGPSLTMGMASLSMMFFSLNNAMQSDNIAGAAPTMVMSGSMLLGVILWPLLSKSYNKKSRAKKEAQRQEKYKEYLQRLAQKFQDESAKQEKIMRETYVPLTDCVARIQNVSRNLWERGPGQNDFLKLRLGLGSGKLQADVSYAERRFTTDEDNLQEDLYTLCETPKELHDIPITLPLYEEHIAGIIGNPRQTREIAKGLIFQIAALYSPDEVKLVFIYDAADENEFYFTKWLPHVWNNEHTFRFIASATGEVKEISAYLEKEIEHRTPIHNTDMNKIAPYYIIFSLSQTLAQKADMLKQIYAQPKNLHISVLTFYGKLKNLPKECGIIAELGTPAKTYSKDDITGQITTFTPDITLDANPTALSVKISQIRLDTLANTYKLPRMVTFLELFGVGKIEHLNALTRWHDNNPVQSLEAAVGVDTIGSTFKLDLHENFHGPHGLVAGMTGSGKSEFIMTYILSLAVNYHPHEVAFILIDYKGGGMAKSFENLPHTAGIITNLDGAAIKRSLISIESELKRRQTLFAQAGKQQGVSNIDIYKYQKLYREQAVREPLPHLFIISDEFAELKTQQPEFMTQLVSAARIGRSLGVHLILATQKPSGVVDDQIWSNSRFRVCLKVQDKSDSQDMLKRPDAAELTETGRFYLQVGYNELFDMGQSAWAGAPYYPADRVVAAKDDSVIVIDRNGRPLREAKSDKKKQTKNPRKQLDAITEYLKTIAAEENIRARPLWLDPIAPNILLSTIKKKYPAPPQAYILNPIIGEYDDPARQRQCVLTLPLSAEGNAVVYGAAGNGKTTFLNTLIYSLMQDHSPDEVNIYLLDFSAETLRAFAKAPHIGDVVLSFETEKISNLFKMLRDDLIKRKKTFADYGGTYHSYIEATGQHLPNIVVAINNFSAFAELYEEKVEALSYLAREGVKYGITFILTALGVNAVRFNMLQYFKQLFTLQLNDPNDYSNVVGRTEGLVPSKHKGRGLVRLEDLHEFQIAHITEEAVPFTFLQHQSRHFRELWRGKPAARIPLLPDQVDAEFLADYLPESIRAYANARQSESRQLKNLLNDLTTDLTTPPKPSGSPVAASGVSPDLSRPHGFQPPSTGSTDFASTNRQPADYEPVGSKPTGPQPTGPKSTGSNPTGPNPTDSEQTRPEPAKFDLTTLSLPIGVAGETLKIYNYPFGRAYITMVFSNDNSDRLFYYDLADFMACRCAFDITVLDTDKRLADKFFHIRNTTSLTCTCSPKECETAVLELFSQILHRNNSYKEALDQGLTPDPFDAKIFIIPSYTALKKSVPDDTKKKLDLLLEKGAIQYNILIIIGEDAQNLPTFNLSSWFKQHVGADRATHGIWRGNGFSEQYCMDTGKKSADANDIPYGFGFCLQKNKAVQTKLLCSKPEDPDED